MEIIVYLLLIPIWFPMMIIGLAYRIAKIIVNGIVRDFGWPND